MSVAGKTVLLVEDESDLREIMQLAMQGLGLTVLTASNGERAYEMWHGHPEIAMILSDIRMPGAQGDGISLTRRVRRDSSVPIILMTGQSKEGDEVALAAGANQIMSKPFELAQLSLVLEKIIG